MCRKYVSSTFIIASVLIFTTALSQYGNHRFWPAVICAWNERPPNVGPCPREGRLAWMPLFTLVLTPGCFYSGTFVVRFFGSGEVAWLGHECVVAWSENDDKSRFAHQGKKPAFLRALEEAVAYYATRKEERVRHISHFRSFQNSRSLCTLFSKPRDVS